MLLRVYGRSDQLADVGSVLERQGSATHASLAPGVRSGQALLTADIDGSRADAVLALLRSRGVAQEDITLSRVDDVAPVAAGHPAASLIWADVLGQANRNARPVARYLVFMIVAGVIAGFGVIYANSTLIVGAMAVSPDTLAITAVCAGVVAQRWRLSGRALATLAIGLGATCLAAAIITDVLRVTGSLPHGVQANNSSVSGLTTINSATVGVALAAGVAAILAVETRASAAVGVGISVTTVPASAYLGVAAGIGQLTKATGAVAVLAVNVTMLVLGGTTTLHVQRRLARRRGATLPDPTGGGGGIGGTGVGGVGGAETIDPIGP